MKKIGLIVLIITILLSGCSKKATFSEEPNTAFNTYMDELFVELTGEDIVNLYFSLSDYKQYGIVKPEVSLGGVSYTEDDIILIQNRLNTLKAFDYSSLDLQQQRVYSNFETNFEATLASEKFDEFAWQFNPSSGLTSNLLTIFMEYKFKDEERVNDYLILLQDIDRLLSEAIELSKQQASSGIFMNDKTIDSTNEAIDKFVMSIDNNQLILSFDERIDATSFLTDEQKQNYKVQNKEIIINEVITGFSAVKEALVALKGSNQYEGGLANYPEGKAYYESIVAAKVGTTKSAEQLFNRAQTYLLNQIKEVQGAVLTQQKAFEEYSGYKAEFSNPTDVITDLMEKSDAYFKRGPEVVFKASFLDESITDENISAYYLVPEYDTPENNVIRINPAQNETNPLNMYLTLAHEGYPGHMYQTTYFYDVVAHPIASAISQIGYTEGWAMYASLFAYDMLGFKEDYTAELFKFDVRFNYVLSGFIDIGVNYYGWDLDTMISEVAELGYDLSDNLPAATDLYYSFIKEPGQILPYSFGLIYFDSYLADAETTLGEKLDLKDYHQMLVEVGPVSFDLLDGIVKAYISEHK